MSLSKLQEIVKDREAWHAAVHGITWVRHDLVTEQQQQKKKQLKDLDIKTKKKKKKRAEEIYFKVCVSLLRILVLRCQYFFSYLLYVKNSSKYRIRDNRENFFEFHGHLNSNPFFPETNTNMNLICMSF